MPVLADELRVLDYGTGDVGTRRWGYVVQRTHFNLISRSGQECRRT